MTTSNLIQLAQSVKAEDLTFAGHDYIVDVVGRERGMSVMQTSRGAAGVTAALVKGNATGKLYFVSRRNANLFVIL